MRSRHSFKNASIKMLDKCKESGLYLGLDIDFDWINYIDYE